MVPLSKLAVPKALHFAKRCGMGHFSGGVGAALLLICGLFSNATAEEFKLGAQDKVRIRVLEWLPAKGTYQAWEALDGEYTVSGEGLVSIPLIGWIKAAGGDVEALSSAIATSVQEKTGLQAPPIVSVEVSQFRPFYVIGAVKTPGEYPWRPEMDVLRAIGVAGGRYRPFEGSPRLERDVITQTGIVQSIELEIVRALARRARLEAEGSDLDEISFPAEVKKSPVGELIAAEERQIFVSRRESHARQAAAIAELKALLETEITALETKATVLERQLTSAQTELSKVSDLASRGLSPANRQFAMDRVLGDLQAQQLDLSTAVVRTRQGVASAERDRIALVEERRLQMAREQQETQALLEQLYTRRGTAQRLIYEAGVVAPQEAANAQTALGMDPTFAITRTVDGRKVRLTATRDTEVWPGDVVELFEPVMARDSAAAVGLIERDAVALAKSSSRKGARASKPVEQLQTPVPTNTVAARPGEG